MTIAMHNDGSIIVTLSFPEEECYSHCNVDNVFQHFIRYAVHNLKIVWTIFIFVVEHTYRKLMQHVNMSKQATVILEQQTNMY